MKNFSTITSVSAKLHSLAKLWLERWLVGLCQCVQCGLGFLLSLRGGEKKQNKFYRIGTDVSKSDVLFFI
jgi:hypothetical protein